MKSCLLALFITSLFASCASADDGSVLKVAVLTDMSGIYSDNSGRGSVRAAQMAIDDVGGRVGGRNIVLVFADHQNKPDVALEIARRWFDEENVDIIVDIPTSSIALAVQRLAQERNKIIIISGSASSQITNESCTPYGYHWNYDTYQVSKVVTEEVARRGARTWFFITVDYSFGHALERDATEMIQRQGGRVVGVVRHPLGTTDYSSFLLAAVGSGADVIAFANAGVDFRLSIKQAAEFGIEKKFSWVVSLGATMLDFWSLGDTAPENVITTEGFYWNHDDRTRAFSERFKRGWATQPTSIHASVYSSLLHYFRAVDRSNTTDAQLVDRAMRELPVEDAFARRGFIREDGRMVHDVLLLRSVRPAKTRESWDVYDVVGEISGVDGVRPASISACSLLRQKPQ
ncbi:ABC transporter substrate-binding protein [Azospirillum brasilense]|uniref:ABC transporter substrate-binding protein n=1 Tax=Azospirillum brasilense TaxID=192 RepID=UPI00190B1A2F|nr:ABC transporter substrate-binding protein [Azospirillum brasilense]MBK3734252.1 ABC transporter substrate-binding protein [Azospirillum brasilense]